MNLKKNILLFYIVVFLESCVFTVPIWYFFFVNFLKFWIWNAILLKTISWFISLLFEVHSWWWADRFGRKKIYILWLIFWIIWYSFYLWTWNLILFFISSWFIWIWYAFTSWSLEALIHDNLEEVWKIEMYNNVQSNQYIMIYIWRAISSLIAWYLFYYNEYLPFIATIICYLIAVIFVLLIKSPKQELSTETSNFKHIMKALIYIKNNSNMLFIIIFLWFFYSWIWNIYWFTYQPYLEQIWIKIKDIWIIYFLISFFSAFWSYLIKNLNSKFSTFKILNIMYIFFIFVTFMFAYINNIFWVLPILFVSILFWFITILWNTYLIKLSPKTHKSTILSIFAFSRTIWYFVFWTTSWYLIQLTSLNFVYKLIPFLLMFVYFLCIYFSKFIKKDNNLN